MWASDYPVTFLSDAVDVRRIVLDVRCFSGKRASLSAEVSAAPPSSADSLAAIIFDGAYSVRFVFCLRFD